MAIVIKRPPNMPLRRLRQERDLLQDKYFKLFQQSEAVRNKVEGLELAISILEKGDQQDRAPQIAPASITNVKGLLLDLARECGGGGINANIAVQLANKKGIPLLRGTAASNLSRLKADGALVHDGDKYKLPEHTRSPQMQLAVHAGGKSS
jgi:hypothetical protein